MIKGIDYTGITCGVICHDGNGRFLLAKRSADCRDEQLTWEFGGGGMEFGEIPEEHARREMREEYNAELADLQLLGTTTLLRQVGGKASHWLVLHWAGRVLNPREIRVVEPEYMLEFAWFAKDSLPSPLHSGIATTLTFGVSNGII